MSHHQVMTNYYELLLYALDTKAINSHTHKKLKTKTKKEEFIETMNLETYNIKHGKGAITLILLDKDLALEALKAYLAMQ